MFGNGTTTSTVLLAETSAYDPYDDNKDIIWPTVVGIFVALALGWMICRYKCSSKERSPHIVRCCPKSLCKNIRLCCMWICRIKSEQQSTNERRASANNKARTSENSLQDASFLFHHPSNNRASIAQIPQQWPPPFILDQTPTFPISIPIQAAATIPVPTTQPKRHPLRRDSMLPGIHNDRRESSLWPFRTLNAVFHKQTSEIKENDLFFSA